MFQTVSGQTLCSLMLHLQFSRLVPGMASSFVRSTLLVPLKESTHTHTHTQRVVFILINDSEASLY